MLTLNDLAEAQANGTYNPKQLPVESVEFSKVNHETVLKEFYDTDGEKTGEIRLELGADGVYIQFDCDCIDALPYCQAQCCALIGTAVLPDELLEFNYPVDVSPESEVEITMKRSADGFCKCLNRESRTCNIYENRPNTCKTFHCTRGAEVRGWKLSNRVHRQSFL
ncbi:YkgJ family cysteine cluster protein [Microcoleus sp. OTE_8_concoct_300]|uniref:YkgJ family cysteine cluster protein n=1 Tax=Microcoleus sp. OTE_8_concoct_300 TaxID=2964710 RepID=UPI00403EF8EF